MISGFGNGELKCLGLMVWALGFAFGGSRLEIWVLVQEFNASYHNKETIPFTYYRSLLW